MYIFMYILYGFCESILFVISHIYDTVENLFYRHFLLVQYVNCHFFKVLVQRKQCLFQDSAYFFWSKKTFFCNMF